MKPHRIQVSRKKGLTKPGNTLLIQPNQETETNARA